MKWSREEIRELVQRHSAAPTVLVTDEAEGPSYRRREALQPRVEEEEDFWVQKQSAPTPPSGGNGGRIPPRPAGNGRDPGPSDHNSTATTAEKTNGERCQKDPTRPHRTSPNLQRL